MYKVYVLGTGKVLYHAAENDNLDARCRGYADKSNQDIVLINPNGSTSTYYHGKLAHDNKRRLAMLQASINSKAAMIRKYNKRIR